MEEITIKCLIGELKLKKEIAMKIPFLKQIWGGRDDKQPTISIPFTFTTLLKVLDNHLYKEDITLTDNVINCAKYLQVELPEVTDFFKFYSKIDVLKRECTIESVNKLELRRKHYIYDLLTNSNNVVYELTQLLEEKQRQEEEKERRLQEQRDLNYFKSFTNNMIKKPYSWDAGSWNVEYY